MFITVLLNIHPCSEVEVSLTKFLLQIHEFHYDSSSEMLCTCVSITSRQTNSTSSQIIGSSPLDEWFNSTKFDWCKLQREQVRKETQTFEDIVGSMALRSLTKLPSRQNVRLARGNRSPGSVQRHLTSGPIFSITSNLTIPPSTRSSSPTFTSVMWELETH